MNKASLPIQPFPKNILKWTEDFYRSSFDLCPFRLQDNDYVIEERKFGGNAQAIVKERWLHHSSLLYNFCSAKMEYLHLPSKAPAYRQQRNHDDFLCGLKDYFSSIDAFKARIVEELKQRFQVKEMEADELVHVSGLPHRRTTTNLSPFLGGNESSPKFCPILHV